MTDTDHTLDDDELARRRQRRDAIAARDAERKQRAIQAIAALRQQLKDGHA